MAFIAYINKILSNETDVEAIYNQALIQAKNEYYANFDANPCQFMLAENITSQSDVDDIVEKTSPPQSIFIQNTTSPNIEIFFYDHATQVTSRFNGTSEMLAILNNPPINQSAFKAFEATCGNNKELFVPDLATISSKLIPDEVKKAIQDEDLLQLADLSAKVDEWTVDASNEVQPIYAAMQQEIGLVIHDEIQRQLELFEQKIQESLRGSNSDELFDSEYREKLNKIIENDKESPTEKVQQIKETTLESMSRISSKMKANIAKYMPSLGVIGTFKAFKNKLASLKSNSTSKMSADQLSKDNDKKTETYKH